MKRELTPLSFWKSSFTVVKTNKSYLISWIKFGHNTIKMEMVVWIKKNQEVSLEWPWLFMRKQQLQLWTEIADLSHKRMLIELLKSVIEITMVRLLKMRWITGLSPTCKITMSINASTRKWLNTLAVSRVRNHQYITMTDLSKTM